jgi:hypothetical protein
MNWREWDWALIAVCTVGVSLAVWNTWDTNRRHEQSHIQFELTAHAQKPEPVKPVISLTATKPAGVYKMNTVDAFSVGGTTIATLDSSGKLDIVEPVFWKMVEQHCVAVFSREQQFSGTYPEQTLKLKCQ